MVVGAAVAVGVLVASPAAGARAKPDLVVTKVSFTGSTLSEHQKLHVSVTVANRGHAASKRTYLTARFLGPRGADIPDTRGWDESGLPKVLTASIIPVKKGSYSRNWMNVPAIKAGRRVTLSREWRVADDYYATPLHKHPRYRLQACVNSIYDEFDSALVPESKTSNDCRTTRRSAELRPPKLPDFQIKNLQIVYPHPTIDPGFTKIEVRGTVVNLGNDTPTYPHSDPVDDVIFSFPYPGCVCENFLFKPLGPGRAIDFDFETYGYAVGVGKPVHYWACADSLETPDGTDWKTPNDIQFDGDTRESHEANNCAEAFGPIATADD